jgi:4,5-dihydroxyphthalate decarboxylase
MAAGAGGPGQYVAAMTRITLRTVTDVQGHTRDLRDGVVSPEGFRLEFEDVPVIEAFRRMVRGLEFDVSEMAFTTYLCAKAHGKPLTALPVFLVRAFHHGAIVRSAASRALRPEDLAGQKVGVSRGYTVTTGVWARGILQDEYGLDLGRVTWVRSGDEHVAEYRPPANVVSMEPGDDLASLVAAGGLAAAIGIPARGTPDLVPLIPGPREAGFEALRQRGLYPINHLLVVRDDLLAAHPGLAAGLFAAYAEAKNRYTARLRRGIGDPSPADVMYRRVTDITGTDPLPYGIEPNRTMIDLMVRHAVNQKILDRPVAAEDLFPPGTHDLTA